MLLQRGAEIDLQNSNGDTALMDAAGQGHERVVELLLQRGAEINLQDSDGDTALMDAAYDDQVYVDDRTIDSHVKRMRKKFRAVDPEFDAIETLYGVGYRYRES